MAPTTAALMRARRARVLCRRMNTPSAVFPPSEKALPAGPPWHQASCRREGGILTARHGEKTLHEGGHAVFRMKSKTFHAGGGAQGFQRVRACAPKAGRRFRPASPLYPGEIPLFSCAFHPGQASAYSCAHRRSAEQVHVAQCSGQASGGCSIRPGTNAASFGGVMASASAGPMNQLAASLSHTSAGS